MADVNAALDKMVDATEQPSGQKPRTQPVQLTPSVERPVHLPDQDEIDADDLITVLSGLGLNAQSASEAINFCAAVVRIGRIANGGHGQMVASALRTEQVLTGDVRTEKGAQFNASWI